MPSLWTLANEWIEVPKVWMCYSVTSMLAHNCAVLGLSRRESVLDSCANNAMSATTSPMGRGVPWPRMYSSIQPMLYDPKLHELRPTQHNGHFFNILTTYRH